MNSSGPVLARDDAGGPLSTSAVSSALRLQAIFLATAAAGVLPFVFWGTLIGHDTLFAASTWIEAAHQWRHGVLWPQWAAGAGFGAGEPRLLFYPPLSWILGGLLFLTLPSRSILGVFGFSALWLAQNSMYRLAGEWMPPRAAVAASLLFAMNPYLLYDLYVRAAYAELLAAAVFPLTLLCAFRLSRHARFTNLRNFALTFALLWLTNVPAAIVASYALAALIFWDVLSSRSLWPLLRCSAGIALASGLAAFYLLPVLCERTWIDPGSLVVLERAYSSKDHVLGFGAARWPHIALQSGRLSGVALVEYGALVLLLMFLRRRGLGRQWTALAVLTVVSGVAVLSPWSFFWHALPLMALVQQSWRWLLVAAVAASVAGAIALQQVRWILLPRIAVVVVTSVAALVYTGHANDRTGSALNRELAASVESGRGYPGLDEYLPPDVAQFDDNGPRVRFSSATPTNARIIVTDWSILHRAIHVVSDAPAPLTIRLLYFPAWRAKVNGGEVPTLEEHSTGLTQVKIPAGASDVELRFTRTPDRTIGGIISLVVLACLVLWPLVRRESRGNPRFP